MSGIDYLAAVRADGGALAAAARRGLDPEVPACPGWTVADLVLHTGMVHRHKAESAHGEPAPVPTPLAADGIDEVLDVFLVPFSQREAAGGGGEALHLQATDAEGGWRLRLPPAGLQVDRGHAEADATARGAASDLLLFLWGRAPATGLETSGDPAVPAAVRGLAARATQ